MASSILDFNTLLSFSNPKQRRPARVAQIIPHEALRPIAPSPASKVNQAPNTSLAENDNHNAADVDHLLQQSTTCQGDDKDVMEIEYDDTIRKPLDDTTPQGLGAWSNSRQSTYLRSDLEEANEISKADAERKQHVEVIKAVLNGLEYTELQRQQEKWDRMWIKEMERGRIAEEMAFRLSCQASTVLSSNIDKTSHNGGNTKNSFEEEELIKQQKSNAYWLNSEQEEEEEKARVIRESKQRIKTEKSLPSLLHEVELGDWEFDVNWEGRPAVEGDGTCIIQKVESVEEDLEELEEKSGSVVKKTQVCLSDVAMNSAGNDFGNTRKSPVPFVCGEAKKKVDCSLSSSKQQTAVLSNTNAAPSSAAFVGIAQPTAASGSGAVSHSKALMPSHMPKSPADPLQILHHPYNHALDSLPLLSATISWLGADASYATNSYLATLSGATTLILQNSIAGRSIAKISGAIPLNRPVPFSESDVFDRRMDREISGEGGAGGSGATTGTLPGNSLQKDNVKLQKLIAEKQKKRAQMAIDKTNRVTEAMGTLALGGGRGRTITSSLMGPGGTERTGRPSRHPGATPGLGPGEGAGPLGGVAVADGASHDATYVEQLDLIYNHTLVKPDLKRSELRCFRRPRLPFSIMRVDVVWQFQIKVYISKLLLLAKASKAAGRRGAAILAAQTGGDGSTVVGSYPSGVMSGASAGGALAQSKILNEAHLSPASDGDLVLFEFCEERPPIQLSKGMASKIVNYYRGDKSKCPISAGGGDRPTRKRQHGDKQQQEQDKLFANKILNAKGEKPPRLKGGFSECENSGKTLAADLIGTIGGKGKDILGGIEKSKDKGKSKVPAVTIIPEGVTEILHPKAHGPFIGEVEEGVTQTGLICNLFVAPMFRHDPEPTDFLMILGKKPSNKHHSMDISTLGVVLRPLPASVYCVGQTEPRAKVFAPNTTGEKNFTAPFVTYQIAKALRAKEKRGLRFDEINDRLFPNTEILPNALRQRIKQVAQYDKNTQIWTLKEVGFEDFPGVEALGRRFSPEGVAAYESGCAAAQRLCDLGIHKLFSGNSSVTSVGSAMVYLNGAVNASRERKSKMSKMVEFAKTSKSKTKSRQIALYERAASKLETAWKELRRKQEVARFIYEELQLAPWHLTSEFIDVHKLAQGTGMMRLTGLGDPSGLGEAYNFLREVDAKPNKGTGNSDGALNAQIKKITGTENDLRKLTMKQMASLLRSYGMGQKEIDTLKRWDRVHVIRDLSTKAASDGMGDGLERYARGEKMKLSDQKQMYRERIQEIWRRQRAALSTDAGNLEIARGPGPAPGAAEAAADAEHAADRAMDSQLERDMDDLDSDSDDDDDLAATFEEDFMDVRQTNELVAAQIRGHGGDESRPVGTLQRAGDTQELSKDARELAALKRQREEERAAQEGFGGPPLAGADIGKKLASASGRKVVKRRITKTHPDGTQTTTFKFVVLPGEVEKVIAAKKKRDKEKESRGDDNKTKMYAKSPKPGRSELERSRDGDVHKKIVGHAMFEDDEEDHHHDKTNIKLQFQKKSRISSTKPRRKNGDSMISSKAPTTLKRSPKLQLGKMKQKASHEKRLKKRRREAEEADLYMSSAKRMGTSNRRERGSARERMPHVIMADRLEQIRLMVEKRPRSGPFHRPVNRRALPHYYEVISEPIDLQTIRDKNQRYEYRSADAFVRDFELMKNNAIKFNGIENNLAKEAAEIYDFVRDMLTDNRSEFGEMEMAVRDQLDSGRAKGKSSRALSPKVSTISDNASKNSTNAGNTANVVLDGISTTVNLGDISFNDNDSDSDGGLLVDILG